MDDFRIEHDTLGEVKVPNSALYGAQTQRALENFPVSGRSPDPAFVWAVAAIKMNAARVNALHHRLAPEPARAIIAAAGEILQGEHMDQFVVDPFQAGAGTSHHMNINEVIANRATVILGGKPGEYLVHPNDHVNMSQSTNDVIPTAIRLSALKLLPELITSIRELIATFRDKGIEFDPIIKSGRTHLQDAVPVRLGQEFHAYERAIERDLARIERSAEGFRRIGIGGTAAGTGINTHAEYAPMMVDLLSKEIGFSLHLSDNLFESMQSMADFSDFSASLRTLALTINRIGGDLRLLASGPTSGLAEIILPPAQPGSSIMPGKVNPVIPEMVQMVMYHVIGLDTAIALAVQAGQLELNVMMPLIAMELLEMMRLMTCALHLLASRCIAGLRANPEMIAFWLERNPILATVLNPIIGYEEAAAIVRQALDEGRSILQIAVEKAENGSLINRSTGEYVKVSEIHALFQDLRSMTGA